MTSDLEDAQQKINEKYDEIQEQNYYEVLGVGEDAQRQEIAKKFRKLAKKWHADRYSGYDLGADEKEKLQEIFSEINNAHRTLSSPKERDDYDASLEAEDTDIESVIDAEGAFRRGQNMLDNGSIKGAHAQFEQAVELSPEEESDYRGHLLYTEYMTLPKDDEGKPSTSSARERTREIFRELDDIADNQSDPQGWLFAFMGHVAQGLGKMREAKSLFNEALRHDRNNRLAQRQKRLLEMREKRKEEEGFFSKIISKFTS